jgi:hypothetical protein
MKYFKFKPFEFDVSSRVLAVQQETFRIANNSSKTPKKLSRVNNRSEGKTSILGLKMGLGATSKARSGAVI